jgi:hypothetical protein
MSLLQKLLSIAILFREAARMALFKGPHKKSVKKIVGRALRNEIDVTEVWKCSYPVGPTNA